MPNPPNKLDIVGQRFGKWIVLESAGTKNQRIKQKEVLAQMDNETTFWLVTNLSYQDAVNLSASDLIKNFQRDAVKGEAKYWPGSKGVFRYLLEHAPEKSLILNDKGEAVRFERGTSNMKTFPVKRPVKMGADIPE